MKLKKLSQEFTICKIPDMSRVWMQDEFFFIGKTDQELSLVCQAEHVPDNALNVDAGWLAVRIEGVLDFSLVGILSELSAILAEEKIGIFAVSTYNTDYILVKKEDFERAVEALEESGYVF